MICICTNRDTKKKIQRNINVYILVDINCLWQELCINESDYYKLSSCCSYLSIDHIQFQVKYILKKFDFVYFEWGKKIKEVFTPKTNSGLNGQN